MSKAIEVLDERIASVDRLATAYPSVNFTALSADLRFVRKELVRLTDQGDRYQRFLPFVEANRQTQPMSITKAAAT